MAPERLKLAPYVVKSEPNTPIYATSPLPIQAPDDWYALITYKEFLAALTMEHIPTILYESGRDHTVTSSDQYFSPRLMPMLDRMKFYFSRMMARARCEAEVGQFEFGGDAGEKKPRRLPIEREDVMSGLEVEAFLAGIEEIRLPGKDNRVVYRRYWRIVKPPAGLELKLGGVVCSGSTMKHHLDQGVLSSIHEQWNEFPKVLVAEFEVHADGRSAAGALVRKA